MSRTSSLLSLLLLALACTPASTVEPTRSSDVQQHAVAVDTAAQAARVERLTAWIRANVDEERYQVPIAGPELSFGAEQGAGVTFVAFIDYQCPYSKRIERELRALAETYPTDVRVVFKHYPLEMHRNARRIAEAVLAAHAQGRGQAMHTLVFEAAPKLSDEQLRELAAQAQVPDLERFWAELEQGVHGRLIDADLELANKLAVASTPSFFVNGAPHRGAKTYEELRELYAAEVEIVHRVLAAGATQNEVYELFVATGKPERERPQKPANDSPRQGRPDPAVHYAVPIDNRPTRGRADALVTIIVFADFQCPYCKKVQTTLTALASRYDDDLRIVFRHQPLPMHAAAKPAALAAIAADRQGQFWAMHDALFAASKDQVADERYYLDTATQLGLDLAQFQADMRDPTAAKIIEDDQAIAQQFGAGGTPSFFVNGRYLAGAQPLEAFVTLIDEELAAAKAYARKHKTPRDQLYATMAKDWETEVKPPPIAERSRKKIDLKKLPGKGELDKPAITLVMCGDFDCPYTARGAQRVDEIFAETKYHDQVGFYFMHFPLPMHKEAMGAHQAAVAAGKQGKFWEMHDLLFADRKRRGEPEYAAMAKELGLDVDQFLADWASADTRATIDANIETCKKLGVSGTPNFFVNGRSMRGAVPMEMISEVFEEELAGGYEATERREQEATAAKKQQ